MEVSILAPVGEGSKAKNRPDDVRAIQQLLNDIPPYDGGAEPKLKVDGVCGFKTCEAIRKFQLQKFRWKLADGRVDPSGATLIRMNECVGPVGPHKSTLFRIRRKSPDKLPVLPHIVEIFVVQDMKSLRNALYVFMPDASFPVNWTSLPISAHGEGSWTYLTATVPSAVYEFEGPASIVGLETGTSSILAVTQHSGTAAATVPVFVPERRSGYFQFIAYP